MVAQNYWNSQEDKTGRTTSTNEIKEIETVADDNKSPLFYVINYKAGGFIVVSSDLRTMPVLAYSETGSLDSKQAPSVNGLKIWFDFAKTQIKAIKKETYGADSIVIKEWKKYAAFKKVKSSGGRKSSVATNTSCQEWYTIGQYMCQNSTYTRGPLLSWPGNSNGVRWGQDRISNFMVPYRNGCGACDRDPAGCGAVAMAQVLWHHRPNTSFDYAAMPLISNTSCTASTFGQLELARLMILCGATASSNYHYAATCNTYTNPWNIPAAISSLGMSNGGSVNSGFNPSIIQNEIAQNNPVILFAADAITNWHIWVCDGVNTNSYNTYNCDTGYCDTWSYTYFYMNWGWEGGSNAWFASGNFNPGNSNYNNYVHMIKGIRR